MHVLALQFEKALEDPSRRRAAAESVSHFCATTRHDFQEHVPSLLTVRVPMYNVCAGAGPR